MTITYRIEFAAHYTESMAYESCQGFVGGDVSDIRTAMIGGDATAWVTVARHAGVESALRREMDADNGVIAYERVGT